MTRATTDYFIVGTHANVTIAGDPASGGEGPLYHYDETLHDWKRDNPDIVTRKGKRDFDAGPCAVELGGVCIKK